MITDDDLLYHAGTIKLNWKKKVDPRNYKRIVSKYGTTREGLIQWQKETSYPIIPDEEEIIHRDEWDLETLNGATIYIRTTNRNIRYLLYLNVLIKNLISTRNLQSIMLIGGATIRILHLLPTVFNHGNL